MKLRYVSVIMDHLSSSLKFIFFLIFAAIVNCNLRFLASAIQRDTRAVTHDIHIYGSSAALCTGNSFCGVGTAYFGISEQTRPFVQQKPVVSEAQVLRFDFRCSLPC